MQISLELRLIYLAIQFNITAKHIADAIQPIYTDPPTHIRRIVSSANRISLNIITRICN